MNDSTTSPFIAVTVGGIGASHVPLPALRVLAGPATGNESNRIRSAIIPLACWALGDIRFTFDSSFVIPEARTEFQVLAQLIAEHREKSPAGPAGKKLRPPPLSIFGHADPTGNDDYNKALSGRRAAAIYGALTRRTEVWEDLFSNKGSFAQPAPGDVWGDPAIQSMRTALNRAESGKTTAAQRKSLFLEYMDFLCVDDQLKPFQIDPAEGFLGQRRDASGKGDYQGCSEFNPILLLSRADKQKFDQEKDHTRRDAANAPNRRVVVLLFRPGSKITPTLWPCPRAKEPTAACRKRFFSDGENRRSNQENKREFKDKEDTFACRFYHRLLTRSPCERTKHREVFRYGIEIGVNFPWTDEAKLRIVSEDGKQEKLFAKNQGVQAGTHRMFSFVEVRTGVKYKGSILDRKQEIEVFGFVDLSKVIAPDDPLDVLPPPQPPVDKVGPDPGSAPPSVLIGPLTDIDEESVAASVDDPTDPQLRVPF